MTQLIHLICRDCERKQLPGARTVYSGTLPVIAYASRFPCPNCGKRRAVEIRPLAEGPEGAQA